MKVSTITPCYKMQNYLPLFLEELPKQTYFENMEIVLDHNDPTDEEINLVEKFNKIYPNKIKHIITKPVTPIGVSMNTCIREASGELLTIWNVDDLRTPYSIEKQVATLKQKKCDIVHGSFIISRKFGEKKGLFVDHSIYENDHKELTRGMVLGPFFMFKKELLNKSGLFDEQLKSGADFDLAIRLSTHGKVVTVKNCILGYYLDEGKGASTKGDGLQPLEKTIIELRYNIKDKINENWLRKLLEINKNEEKYKIRFIKQKEEYISVQTYL